MKHSESYKQFAKDCPKHFSEEILKNASLKVTTAKRGFKVEKSTRNSKSPNRF